MINLEKINSQADLTIEKSIKVLKEVISFPFFCLFMFGTTIQILGWMGVEAITGEKVKEIKIVPSDEVKIKI